MGQIGRVEITWLEAQIQLWIWVAVNICAVLPVIKYSHLQFYINLLKDVISKLY
jgi:hypothetical protein